MQHRAASTWTAIWEPLLLTVALLIFSFISAPIPAVNEPHYLTKAKHYWQPDWCAGDTFLESTDVHAVFYAVIGPITTVLTLEQTAWLGRGLALTIVAVGWTQLGRALQFPRGASPLAAAVFLLFQSVGNWSGEWFVGGVEGKVFSYGFLIWAAAAYVQRKLVLAGALQGLAISFHPVVGMWGLLAAGAAQLTLWWRKRRVPGSMVNVQAWWWSVACCVMVLLALPGLIPVFELLRAPVDRDTKFAATYIQVFHRLAHHLDPMRFPLRAHIGFAALVVVWSTAMWRFGAPSAERQVPSAESDVSAPSALGLQPATFLHSVVAWSLIFAVGGLLIAAGPRPPEQMPGLAFRMPLMKFYPFRLVDVLLPSAIAWMAAEFYWRRVTCGSLRRASVVLLWSIACVLAWHGASTAQARLDARPDWVDVCRWFRNQTPSDVLVQTPNGRYTFKWYAERPEYVSFKDCPQDDAGIVEWNRRLLFLKKWYQQQFADGRYSSAELFQLARDTGITHIVTDRLGPMEPDPTYQNATYRVYDLRAL